MFDKVEFKRASLYDEVWQEPMSAVATRHKISVDALRKICKSLEVPLPQVGYWAKHRAGKRVRRTPLRNYDGPAAITHQVRLDPDEAVRREEAARIRTEQWSASIRMQVEARKERLRIQAEFFEEADKWLELQRRLRYLDHIESVARGATLSDEDKTRINEWIESTRVVCMVADPTESRIKAIIAIDDVEADQTGAPRGFSPSE